MHFESKPFEDQATRGAEANGEPVYVDRGNSFIQIAEYIRDEQFKLKLQVREFNGGRYVDLRLHERGEGGRYYPTKRGLTLKPSELDSIITALERAKYILRPKGRSEVEE